MGKQPLEAPSVLTTSLRQIASLSDSVAARKDMKSAETHVDKLLAEHPVWPREVQEAKTALVNYFKHRVTVMQSEDKSDELKTMQNVVNHFVPDLRPKFMPDQLEELKILYHVAAKTGDDEELDAATVAKLAPLMERIEQSAGRINSSVSSMNELRRREIIFAKAEQARKNRDDYAKTIAELDV